MLEKPIRSAEMTTGRILHLQRLSTEDGPGLRTTLFFKGCPLRCDWCHNPESFSQRIQMQWYPERCLGCHTCLSACPHDCLSMSDDGLLIDREHCPGCAACAEACPANAIEALGKDVTVEEVLGELLKDRVYFEKSGGGVTLSGGEPTLQPDFAEALLRGLKAEGIATALDTCGFCSSRTLERLLPFTDLVLYDLKLSDSKRHRALTGQPNEPIIENLQYIAEYKQKQNKPIELWIRTPLIPGATTGDENLIALGEFITHNLNGSVARWELCAFNNLCRAKYQRLGLEWAYVQQSLLTAEELAHCEQVARLSGIHPEIILSSGTTRLKDST